MSKIYLTSDFHFDHKNIIKYASRPFDSVHNMNYEIVRRYNSVVNNNDTVYILGDFQMGKSLDFLPQLNGNKKILLGNHDKLPTYIYEQFGYEVIPNSTVLNDFVLVHSPADIIRTIKKDFEDMPHGYESIKDSKLLPKIKQKYICGHVHKIFKTMGSFTNVSVDVWDFFPVELATIEIIYK